MSFVFVDRIRRIESGEAAEGVFELTGEAPAPSAFVLSEAVGQLAAWVAMEHAGFRLRPVAGIAGEVTVPSRTEPGRAVDLAVRIRAIDDGACSYDGQASQDGRVVARLRRCLGPMLAADQFDDPDALARRFAKLLEGGASAPERSREVAEVAWERGDRGEQQATASLVVPAKAPWVADHFPRKTVLPGTLLLQAMSEMATDWLANRDGQPPQLDRVHSVKLRSFLEPGTRVDVVATPGKGAGPETVVALEAAVEGRRVASVRCDFRRAEG